MTGFACKMDQLKNCTQAAKTTCKSLDITKITY